MSVVTLKTFIHAAMCHLSAFFASLRFHLVRQLPALIFSGKVTSPFLVPFHHYIELDLSDRLDTKKGNQCQTLGVICERNGKKWEEMGLNRKKLEET